MQEEVDNNNWDIFILLSVYNEIQTEANRNIANRWLLKQEQIMRKSIETIIKSIPIVCECKITKCWQK